MGGPRNAMEGGPTFIYLVGVAEDRVSRIAQQPYATHTTYL